MDDPSWAGAELAAPFRRQAVVIACIYACVAGLWILTSDRLLGALAGDTAQLVEVSVYKGLAFVLVTAGLLYLLLGRMVRRIERALALAKREGAERQLQQAERRRAEAIVQSTDDAVISKTPDGLIASWNPAAESMFGYRAEEIVGRSGDVLIPAQAANEEPLSGQRIKQRETIRMRKDGSCFPVAITFSWIWDYVADGGKTIAGLSEIVRDISERKQSEALAERERRFAESLVEAMPGVLYLYNEQGQFLRWNRNFEKVTGFSAAEILASHPLDFFSGADRALLQERIAQVLELGESSVEASFIAKDGTAIPYFFTGRRILFDGQTCLIGVGVDISERKRAEQAVRELNESLELKIRERTLALDEARQRAEAADRLKSAFLATMSHELRTPLNSIIGFTGIVLQGLAGPLNPEQSKQLGMVRGSARHLLALINDVLDISKIEAGQLEVHPAPFDLRAAIARVAGLVEPLAQKKGIALKVVVPAGLDALESDERRVEQILLNLLNNGIKFTERGSVTLTLDVREDAASPGTLGKRPTVRLEVADTGIGIRPEHLSQLFQPFRQIDSGLQRQHEGTGLGLAICRRLAELLGGTISARSVWGEGSVFSVELPMKWASS